MSSDERRADAALFAKEVRATFPVVHDAKATIWNKLGVVGQPTNIVVDRRGKVTKVVEGSDIPAIEAAIVAALNPSAAAGKGPAPKPRH